MPKIPTANERQVREQAHSGRGFKSQLGDNTSKTNLLGGLAGAGQKVFEIQQAEQLKAEEAQANEYKLLLRNKKIELTHDKDKGFFSQRGKNAAMNEKKYSDEFSQYGDTELEKFAGGSERLKTKLSLIKQGFQADLKGQYASHTARENQAYEDDMFTANMASLHSEAVLDNKKIGESIQTQKELIYGARDKDGNLKTIDGVVIQPGIATTKGMSKEKADQMFLAATTKLHGEVLTNMMDNDQDQLAKDYFQVALKNGEISGEAAKDIEKALEKSSINGESQRLSESIISEGLSIEESKAKARATIDDPELKDLTVKRINNRMKEERAAKEYSDRQYFESLGDKLYEDPANFKLTAQMNQRLTLAQQDNLTRLQHKLTMDKVGKPTRKESDMATYNKIANMSSEEFQKYDLLQDQNKLTTAHLTKFIDAKKKDGAFKGLQTVNKFVSGMIKGQGLEKDDAAANEIQAQFERELNLYPKDQQGKLETLNKIRNEMLIEMKMPWYKRDIPLYEARQKGIKTTPDTERPKGAPRDSSFVDTVINGKRIVGWEQKDPNTGESIYFDQDGKPLYARRRKK